MRNIPLRPGLKQPKEVWGKEIETLQALYLMRRWIEGSACRTCCPIGRVWQNMTFLEFKERVVFLKWWVKMLSIWCPNHPCKRRFWRCGTFDLPLTFERRSSTIIWYTRAFLPSGGSQSDLWSIHGGTFFKPLNMTSSTFSVVEAEARGTLAEGSYLMRKI